MTKGLPINRDHGSFRDPSGYVFRRNGSVFRAIDSASSKVLRELFESGIMNRLIQNGQVVASWFVEDSDVTASLENEHPGFENFLQHELIRPILYPMEWSLSMLADAGTLTLDLQIQLLEHGYSLKDATAYNIQFVNGRPIFIDLPSIERPARLDVWYALGQFGQMFTYPLLLSRHNGWDLRSYFLGELGGRDLVQVTRSLGPFSRWLPRNLLDVTLPGLLHGRFEQGKTNNGDYKHKNTKADAQLINLKRIRKKIRRLADGYRPRSSWTGYASQCNYDVQAFEDKKGMVARYLKMFGPQWVLDVGCNTGDFSYLAADLGSQTIAADQDHDAVEVLYRRLQSKPAKITPIVLDLCNPTPPIGYLNRERPSFLSRINVDCVLALALIHHLRVSGNLSLQAIRDLFVSLTKRYLILEFVPTNDSMFRRLAQLRLESFEDFTLSRCRDVFVELFDILCEETIPGTERTLLLLRKKAD